MAQVKKEVILSLRQRLEREQNKLRYDIANRTRAINKLAHEQEIAKREIAELHKLIKTLPEYK